MPWTPPPNLTAGPFASKGMGPRTLDLKTEGKPPPPKGPTGHRVEDRIGIRAPAELVWEIVYDVASWGSWNPTYTSVKGDIRIGSVLEVTLVLPGEEPQVIRPKVIEWQPPNQLHWQLKMLGGAIRTLRYIEIDPLAEASCIVDNGELFGGVMGASFGKRMGKTVQRGFHAMNEALKTRAEALWEERQR